MLQKVKTDNADTDRQERWRVDGRGSAQTTVRVAGDYRTRSLSSSTQEVGNFGPRGFLGTVQPGGFGRKVQCNQGDTLRVVGSSDGRFAKGVWMRSGGFAERDVDLDALWTSMVATEARSGAVELADLVGEAALAAASSDAPILCRAETIHVTQDATFPQAGIIICDRLVGSDAATIRMTGPDKTLRIVARVIEETQTIDVSGAPGDDGASGQDGATGLAGIGGATGRKGKDGDIFHSAKRGKGGGKGDLGGLGGQASNGTDGGHGEDAGDVFVDAASFPPGTSFRVIARGGLGGRGGQGGTGGQGGAGGDGGTGGKGGSNEAIFRKGARGGPGGAGGDGGDGRNGGTGGSGGDGGDGGNLTLTVLQGQPVPVVSFIGEGGEGGQEGTGGRPGLGGQGGKGGDGGEGGNGSSQGAPGQNGKPGLEGRLGGDGEEGETGEDGEANFEFEIIIREGFHAIVEEAAALLGEDEILDQIMEEVR